MRGAAVPLPRCSEGWTGCTRDHAAEAAARGPVPQARRFSDEAPFCCDDCRFFARAGSHRLERWRFGALRHLIHVGRIKRSPQRYSFSPLETATELALLLGDTPPPCKGSAWRYLKDKYDPVQTPLKGKGKKRGR
jgi:hypothetical protein